MFPSFEKGGRRVSRQSYPQGRTIGGESSEGCGSKEKMNSFLNKLTLKLRSEGQETGKF